MTDAQPGGDQPGGDDQLRRQRLDKLERVAASGVNPWPARVSRSHTTAEAQAAFSEDTRVEASSAGRITALRDLGKLSFLQIQDGSGKLQLSFQVDDLAERYEDLKNLDFGDFIGVSGYLWRTRRGEITLRVQQFQLLAKALRQPPEKWHGLTDPEKRYRQRYLDLMSSDEVRSIFQRRARIIGSLRRYLDDRGFMEVDTPALQPVYGGAAAKPFTTHHNALDRDLYLRISDELYLKRLIIGGYDRVYEIGKNFRNEGLDLRHNPEFSAIELYQAYADIGDILNLTEDLIRHLAVEVSDSGVVEYGGNQIDFTKPFARVTMREAIQQWAGIDMLEGSLDQLAAKAGLPAGAGRGKLIDEIFGRYVEPNLIQPVFVTDYPVELSPLAKRRTDDPRLVERFELVVSAMELANAFSELNDPLDQRARLVELAERRAAGDEEASPIDEDFIEAMEYGMPPTGGMGMGIDRLVMLLTGQTSIREVILFPQMRTILT